LPSDATTRVSDDRPPPQMPTFSGPHCDALPLAIPGVVQVGHRTAKRVDAADRGVLVVVGGDVHVRGPWRRPGQRAGFRLPLSQVAPPLHTSAKAELARPVHDMNDAGARNGAESRHRGAFGNG
jgi:hypothetical protein